MGHELACAAHCTDTAVLGFPGSAAQKSHDLALVWRTIYCVAGRPRDLPEVLESRGESGSESAVGDASAAPRLYQLAEVAPASYLPHFTD